MAAFTTSDSFERELLKRAYEAHLTRHRGPIVVHDATPAFQREAARFEHDLRLRSGPVEIRSTPELVDVKQSRRQVDLIVMPYEREAYVAHHGRMIGEIIDRAAFVGVEHDVGRIRVNRDHVRERTCGKAVLLDPGHPTGLFASLRISRTPLGDETLALAEEGILDASAGFACLAGGEKWEGTERRRITRAFLDHIAMTPAPAYEDAKVLAVRAAELAELP
jgi:HK97 family phage prohead protease